MNINSFKTLSSVFYWNVTSPTDHKIKNISMKVSIHNHTRVWEATYEVELIQRHMSNHCSSWGERIYRMVDVLFCGFQVLLDLSVQWFLLWATILQQTFLENFWCYHYVCITSTEFKKLVYCYFNSKYSLSSSKWLSSNSQLWHPLR